MTNREDILKELKEIAPILAKSQNKEAEYIVPENYFNELDLALIKNKKKEEYTLPKHYFATLGNRFEDRLKEEKNIDNQKRQKTIPFTKRISMLTGLAASLLLLVYVSVNYNEISSPIDYSDQELAAYLEENIDEMDIDELLVLQEDELDSDPYDGIADDDLIDYYIEQNIYSLEEEFLSELIE